MSTDLYTALPTSTSPTIRARAVQGGTSLPKFEISPSHWGNVIHSQSLLNNAYQPLQKMPSVPVINRHPIDECPDMERSWETIHSPERHDSAHDGHLQDASVVSLSDWDIVCKPLSLSESQYPATLSTTSLTDVVCALSSPSSEEGIVISEPMDTESQLLHTTHVSNSLVCTTLAVYEPNHFQNLILQKSVIDANLLVPNSKDSSAPSLHSSWKGLHNLGNTCYMNASLQALLSLEGFVEKLIAASSHELGYLSPKSFPKKVLMEQLAYAFRRLRGEDIFEKNNDEWTPSIVNSENSVNPARFKKFVDEKTPLFVGYQQHDAHEFMTTLLDLLHDELKCPQSIKQSETTEPPQIETPSCTTSLHPSDMQEDCNYVVVNGMTASGLEGMSQNYAKKAKLGSASDSFDFEQGEDRVDENSNSRSSNQCRISLSEMNMEGIEELLSSDTGSVNIQRHQGSWNSQEQNVRSWKPFWKSKSRSSGYLAGGRSIAAPLLVSNLSRRVEYKSMDQSWHVIGNDWLQGHSETLLQESNVPRTENLLNSGHPLVCTTTMDENEAKKESLVESHFTTEIRNHLTCDSCKFTRSQIETFRCLSLELVDNNLSLGKALPGLKFNQTLQDSLRKFLAPEKREVKCEKCFFDWATKTTEITKLPNALILHLKRFIVDVNPDYMMINCRKNHTPIEISKYLSLNLLDDDGVLAEYLANDVRIPTPAVTSDRLRNKEEKVNCENLMDEPKYCLRSIVNHVGSSAEYGHYTSTVHRTTVTNDYHDSSRRWLYCDDDTISDMNENQVFDTYSQSRAYLFLYELEGVTS